MNLSDEYLKRLVEAVERMAPPPPPVTGLHRHDVTERAISIRNTSKGKSLCQWTATEEPIPVSEVNAITGKFTSFRWNIKSKTEKDGSVSHPKYLMVHMESSPTDVCVVRSNLTSNWSFQLLLALETLPKDALFDQFTIVLIPNDMEKYDPAVFCRLYHKGVEVKYQYKKELKEDPDYLIGLVESFNAYLNPAEGEPPVDEDYSEGVESPTKVPYLKVVPQPPELKVVPQLEPPVGINTLLSNEYTRLDLPNNPERAKVLLKEHFGEGVTSKTLTPEQKEQWLDILREQSVEVPPAVAEAVAEALDEQPIAIGAESVNPELTLSSTELQAIQAQLTQRETELGMTKEATKKLLMETFNKRARNLLTDSEMVQYLKLLNS